MNSRYTDSQTDKLIEAVARGLCAADGGYPDDTAFIRRDGCVEMRPDGWRRWHDYRGRATRLVAAVRRWDAENGLATVPTDPDDAMIEAGEEAITAPPNLWGHGVRIEHPKGDD